MKTKVIMVAFAAALLLVMGLPATTALGTTVTCAGSTCSPQGSTNYQYWVRLGPNEKTNCFFVGTCDLLRGDYTNILSPAGWDFKVISSQLYKHHTPPPTAHGIVSPPPDGYCAGYILWVGPELSGGPTGGMYKFGFDNPYPAHNVGFDVSYWDTSDPDKANWTYTVLKREDWSKPVGTGDGPVHGPIGAAPEPATAAIMILGVTLIATKRRRVNHGG